MKTFHKLSLFVAGLSSGLLLMGSGLSLAAANASFSLSPASASENVNSTFALGVYENGNANPVNVATANLSYDQTKLQFVSASCGGVFSSTVSASGGNGSVSLSCYTVPGAAAPTDNELVGTVNFMALGGSGSTSVSFASGSMIASNGVNVWDAGTTGGTYSLITPTPVTPPAATGSGSTETTTPSTTSTTPVSTTTSGSTTEPSNQRRHQAHLLNGQLVASTAALSTKGDWATIAIATIVAAAIIVFRQKVLASVKVVSVKYQLYRRK